MNQQGRSMVEMLGVLAIIGVLSVGAIAGYSSAMTKYKLNKQAEQIGFILDSLYLQYDDFKEAIKKTPNNQVVSLLTKLNIIPQEMIKTKNSTILYDALNNKIILQKYRDSGKVFLEFTVRLEQHTKPSCINLYQIAKQRSSLLYFTKFEVFNRGHIHQLYGDKYCGRYMKCLKDLTLAEMSEFCDNCSSYRACLFYFQNLL